MDFYVFEMLDVLENIGVINSCSYAEYTDKYAECGTFKVKCALIPENLSILQKDNIILFENGICGIIETISKSKEERRIVVSGKMADALLDRRCTKRKTSYTGMNVGDVFESLYDVATEENTLPLIETDFPAFGENIDIDFDAGSLQTHFEALCIQYDLGYKVRMKSDCTGFLLTVYEGIGKTFDNGELSPVIISPEFDSAKSNTSHELSTADYYDKLYVAGADNTMAILTLPTAEENSMHLKERVLNCLSMQKGEKSAKQYLDTLIERGRQEISNDNERITYNAEITDKTFVFGLDYTLGDMITTKDQTLDVQQNRRVMSATVYFSDGVRSVSVAFGEPQLDIQKVLVTTNKQIAEVRKLFNYPAPVTTTAPDPPTKNVSTDDVWNKVKSATGSRGAVIEAVYKFMEIPEGTPDSDIVRIDTAGREENLYDTVSVDVSGSTAAEPEYSQTQETRAWVRQYDAAATEYAAGTNITFRQGTGADEGKTFIDAAGGGSGGGITTWHENFGSATTTVINSAEYKNERTVTVPWTRYGKTLKGFIVHGYIDADDLIARKQLLEFSKMGFEGAESEYMTDYMKYPLQLTEITGYNSANRPIYERLVYWGVSYSGMYTDNITFRVVDLQYGLNRSSEWSIDVIYS